jgi:hypothetical protein
MYGSHSRHASAKSLLFWPDQLRKTFTLRAYRRRRRLTGDLPSGVRQA